LEPLQDINTVHTFLRELLSTGDCTARCPPLTGPDGVETRAAKGRWNQKQVRRALFP